MLRNIVLRAPAWQCYAYMMENGIFSSFWLLKLVKKRCHCNDVMVHNWDSVLYAFGLG